MSQFRWLVLEKVTVQLRVRTRRAICEKGTQGCWSLSSPTPSPLIFRLCTAPGSRCSLRTEDTMSPLVTTVVPPPSPPPRDINPRVLVSRCIMHAARCTKYYHKWRVLSLRVHQDGSLFALARNPGHRETRAWLLDF